MICKKVIKKLDIPIRSPLMKELLKTSYEMGFREGALAVGTGRVVIEQTKDGFSLKGGEYAPTSPTE